VHNIQELLHHCGLEGNLKSGVRRLGETVLHYAIMANKKVIVEKLLEKGMDPRIDSTPSVPSPLQMAANLGPVGKEMYALLRGTTHHTHARTHTHTSTGSSVHVRYV
jgi:hypothetical protein